MQPRADAGVGGGGVVCPYELAAKVFVAGR